MYSNFNLRDSVMVARMTLNHEIQVRPLVPQLR